MLKMLKLNDNGLTIIEVAVATVVLSIAAISISTIFGNINNIQISSDRKSSAIAIAERKIEELRNNHYNTLQVTNPPDASSPTLPTDFSNELTDFPNGVGKIEIDEPAANLKKINVTITYTEEGASREVRMTAIIGALGIAQ